MPRLEGQLVPAWPQDIVHPHQVMAGGLHYGVVPSPYGANVHHAPGPHYFPPAGPYHPHPHPHPPVPNPYFPPYFPPGLPQVPNGYLQMPNGPVQDRKVPDEDVKMVPYSPENERELRKRLQNEVPPTTLDRVMDDFRVLGKVSSVLWEFRTPLIVGIASLMTASYVKVAKDAGIGGFTGDRQVENVFRQTQAAPEALTYLGPDGRYYTMLDPDCTPRIWKTVRNTALTLWDGQNRDLENACFLNLDKINQEEYQKKALTRASAQGTAVVAVDNLQDARIHRKIARTEIHDRKREQDEQANREYRDNKAAYAARYGADIVTRTPKRLWKIAKYYLG